MTDAGVPRQVRDPMSDKHEFGSPSWLREICLLAERALADAGVDLRGINYIFGEEFLDVPGRLNPHGAQRIGWTVRITDGAVTSEASPPPDDADLINFADWDMVEPLAHRITGQSPERDQEIASFVADLEDRGKLRRAVRRERPAALVPLLAPLHNQVVAITGPRRG